MLIFKLTFTKAINCISNVFPGNQICTVQEHTRSALIAHAGDAGLRPYFKSPLTKNDYSVRKKKFSMNTTLITHQIFAVITTAVS